MRQRFTASKCSSYDDLYGDIFLLMSVLACFQYTSVHQEMASAAKKTKHWEHQETKRSSSSTQKVTLLNPFSELFSVEVFTMKMSKSLKVFEGSIIRSEKLFNLISQVGSIHQATRVRNSCTIRNCACVMSGPKGYPDFEWTCKIFLDF